MTDTATLSLDWLEEDFTRSKNPAFAWIALRLSYELDLSPPGWVLDYLASAAARMLDLRFPFEFDNSAGPEAERVGWALGFADKKKGETGFFEAAFNLGRDRHLHALVVRCLAQGDKRTHAWEHVAKREGLSPSMVQRAYKRIQNLPVHSPKQSQS